MTPVDFEDLIDHHGGDPKRWPCALQAEAAALLDTSAQARKALAALQEVEHLLALSQGGVSEDMTVAAWASRVPQVRPANRFVMRTGWSAAAAALLAIGILVGRTSGINGDDDPSLALARTLASTEIINVD